MSHKYRLGERVKILWEKTQYYVVPNYTNVGVVRGYGTARDGTPLIELHDFHKTEHYHILQFPIHAIRPLAIDVKDGDTL